jgi:ATP phosphoribosyltransferase regulatory subunit
MAGGQLHPERQMTQIGCELIGSLAPAADAEVILLAAECLQRIGIENISIDLTLPTLVPNLLKLHTLDAPQHSRVMAAIERRDTAMAQEVNPELGPILARVIGAVGPARAAIDILDTLDIGGEARIDIERLIAVVALIEAQASDVMLTVDPVERRGFEYHTGLSFALFARGLGEVGRGGRYRAGGREGEPATGFTLIADNLLAGAAPLPKVERVFLPVDADPAIGIKLRQDGLITIASLVDEADLYAAARRQHCDYVWEDGLQAVEMEH